MTDDIVDIDAVQSIAGKINRELENQDLTPMEAIIVLKTAMQYWINYGVKNDLIVNGLISGPESGDK